MTSLRVFLISVLLALGVAVPVVAAFATAPSTHSAVTRVAEGPTPTPSGITYPMSPCGGQGC